MGSQTMVRINTVAFPPLIIMVKEAFPIPASEEQVGVEQGGLTMAMAMAMERRRLTVPWEEILLKQ